MRFCLVPVIPEGTDERREAMRKRWAKLVMLSTLLLLVSGLYNSYYMAVTYQLNGLYLGLLTVKILLALVVFLFAAILSGRSENAKNMRQKELNWLNILCVSMLLLVLIAGFMKTMEHEKKDKEVEQTNSAIESQFHFVMTKFNSAKSVDC